MTPLLVHRWVIKFSIGLYFDPILWVGMALEEIAGVPNRSG
jgi:hypothetical protein